MHHGLQTILNQQSGATDIESVLLFYHKTY